MGLHPLLLSGAEMGVLSGWTCSEQVVSRYPGSGYFDTIYAKKAGRPMGVNGFQYGQGHSSLSRAVG